MEADVQMTAVYNLLDWHMMQFFVFLRFVWFSLKYSERAHLLTDLPSSTLESFITGLYL